MHHVYGPVSSRRLGQSLGISPMIKKTCNYNCIYCQLGSTLYLTNQFQVFESADKILSEVDTFLSKNVPYDVVSIVGNGEPTLYDELGVLIDGLKVRTKKPICLITNGALLYEPKVFQAALKCDIVLPSMNGFDAVSHAKINRPHKALDFNRVFQALVDFSKVYTGLLWLEIMVIKGINDHNEAINGYKALLNKLTYDRLYLNVAVRAPSQAWVEIPDKSALIAMREALGGILIDYLSDPSYTDMIDDDYLALTNILRHHPLHQFEIKAFLNQRDSSYDDITDKLEEDSNIEKSHYKGLVSYRYHG